MKNLKKLIILSGVLCFYFHPCYSQINTPLNDSYVIVLDVQQYWTDKALSKTDSEGMVKAINAIIEKTNSDKIIYIKTTAVSKILSVSFKGIHIDTLFAEEFDKDLRIVNDRIFEKKEGDAFTVNELAAFLEQNNAKEIIITGLLAEKCVYKTSIGGLSRNYDIYLIPEAIGGKSDKSKEKSIEKLEKMGAKILTLSDL